MKKTHFKYSGKFRGNGFALCVFLALWMVFGGCKDKDKDGDECLSNYPVATLLSHYAEDLIIPDYVQFQSDLNGLFQAFGLFESDITGQHLDSLRTTFVKAYMQWQVVSFYEFGPAEDVYLRNSLNNFPVNEEALRFKMRAENYDFSSPTAYDKGFPALDYLLYGYAGNDADLLDSFNQNARLRTYVGKVLDDMVTRTNQVVNQWVSGTYAGQFKKNTGLAAGQSFSLIVNSLNENFEILRRNRIGIPSGVLTLNFPNPTEVEALYSSISLQLALQSLKASRRYFDGAGGEGLDNVLDFIHAKKHDRNLSTLIFEQFGKAEAAIQAIPETLSESVTAQSDKVIEAYNQLSPLVVMLKSDMPSVMCIAITYVDNPSDSD